MAPLRFRRIPSAGLHRPHGTSWALARGAIHAITPDPAAPGPVRGLEREAGFHLQAGHAVAFGSASAALELLLAAMALPAGAQVLLPAIAQPWVQAAVLAGGCTPVPVDVRPDTLHLDPAALQAAAGPTSAAVLVAHTAGVPCDLDALGSTCRSLRLPLIELFGAAVGARWRCRPVGAHGHAGLAALDCGQLTAFGGALVVSDQDTLVSQLRQALAQHPEPPGWRVAGGIARAHLRALLAHPSAFGLLHRALPARAPASTHSSGSGSVRLHPAQAEATRTALAELEPHLDGCRERAAQLRYALPQQAWRQDVPDGALPAWSQLLVRSRDPQACAQAAHRQGVQLRTQVLSDLSQGRCPHAARAAAECVALPCHDGLRDTDIERVSAAVANWLI